MRRRDPSIPLFLWIATAALVHILWSGGAEQVVSVVEGQRSIARLADSVRSYVRQANQRVEISFLDETPPPRVNPTPNDVASDPTREDDPKKESLKPTPEKDPKLNKAKQKDAEAKLSKEEDRNKDRAKPKPEEKPKPQAEQPKEPEKPKPVEVPAKPVQPLKLEDRRIAVDQHVKEEQKDNPDARFIGDKANHVAQETQARLTSRDQNDPNPTLSKDHHNADNQPGDSDTQELGRSEDQKGDPKRSPNPNEREAKLAENHAARESAAPRPAIQAERAAQTNRAALKGQVAQAERKAQDPVPNTLQGNEGQTIGPSATERESAREARIARLEQALQRGNTTAQNLRNFGILGTTPSGLNPNLTPQSALAAVGEKQLAQERVMASERRRSQHRGSWKLAGLERWRAAIENYVASVQPGNQTALNTARVPFARYINQMHQRIHEHFADSFLSSLSSMPSDHPLNRPDLHTELEIVLNHEDGRVLRMGITRASGSTMFDVSALESVQQASPFGASPSEIVSPDGNVYVHWEFFRNPDLACSTYFAKPFLLKVKPAGAPLQNPSPPPAEPEQHGSVTNSGAIKG